MSPTYIAEARSAYGRITIYAGDKNACINAAKQYAASIEEDPNYGDSEVYVYDKETKEEVWHI